MPSVVFECDEYFILFKEHGLNTEPDSRNNPNLMTWLKLQRPEFYKKWGPHPLHRLDRPVSGLLMVAKSLKAHRILQRLFEGRYIRKKYLARVAGQLVPTRAALSHFHQKDHLNHKAVISNQSHEGYLPVRLTYVSVRSGPDFADLDIRLITGRYHQIRAQLAHVGHPIWGDTLYGSQVNLPPNIIALCAYHLSFQCPFQKKNISYEELPDGWGYW